VNDPAPRIALTPGEPAGVGPELTLLLALQPRDFGLVAVADIEILRMRARELELDIRIEHWQEHEPIPREAGHLSVLDQPFAAPAVPGRLNPANAGPVLDSLRVAISGCLHGRFDALVTGPVHKGVINEAGIPFSGHTEFLADECGRSDPVMLLVGGGLRVALATTHLPLREVSRAITSERLRRVLKVLNRDLRERFGLAEPRILVCGLNPHAGESGHMGREEVEVIGPTIEALRTEGLTLYGPVPADTAFTPQTLASADAVLAMYHDQGLPVLKHAGFGHGVNVTLGLPIIRTSVDHGTALDLAGSGRADPGSLRAATALACELHRARSTQTVEG
jgi:4-hydroxythreonine-4-phosphate dehydrogenase